MKKPLPKKFKIIIITSIFLFLIFVIYSLYQFISTTSAYLYEIYSPIALDSVNEVYYLKRVKNYNAGSTIYKLGTLIGPGSPTQDLSNWLKIPFIGKPQVLTDKFYICRNNMTGTSENCPASFVLPINYPQYISNMNKIQEEANLSLTDFIQDSEGNLYFSYTINSERTIYKKLDIVTGPFAMSDINVGEFDLVNQARLNSSDVQYSNWEFTGKGSNNYWEFHSPNSRTLETIEQNSVIYITDKATKINKPYLNLATMQESNP